MPFIWDDLYWHVVSKDEDYDKNRFAVVRTLFIQLNAKYYYYTKALKSFNRVQIRKEFENYGNIESVELLDNDKPEVYVTFVDDKSAAMAFGLMNCENDLKITEREYLCLKKYIVQPANTWHQPSNSTDNKIVSDALGSTDYALSAIGTLNEDCLRHLFTFCDEESLINLMDVCTTFKDLLSAENGSTTFRRFTTLRLVTDVIEKDRFGKLMTVGKARRLLRHFSPYITKLVVKKLDEANVQRYFEKIAQYVGKNVREMEIYDIRLTESLMWILQSIFYGLSELKIRIPANGCNVDFQKLCPNLTKLKIVGITNIEASCKCWPNLQHISLLSDIISPELFCSFISLNPHLKSVKFYHQNLAQIESVCNNLLNVEKLEIDCKYKSISANQLDRLCRLSHLVQLNLWNLTGHTAVVEIFLVLAKFSGLRKLKLHISEDQSHEALDSGVYELKQHTIAELAQRLVNLQKLLLFNIKLDETTVYDIVRSASQLKALHIHDSNVNGQWDASLITAIVNIRRSIQQEHVLKLFLDENLNVSMGKSDQRYLRIYSNNFGCKHAKMKYVKK